MSQPSMIEAAKIRDVAARHAYVFDNGLSSPDFFDLPKRMASEEFELILEWTGMIGESILEVGCFTGLNLLGLASLGHSNLYGVDFVNGAINWLVTEACRRQANISARVACYPDDFEWSSEWSEFSTIICFDTLEHQRNCGYFLDRLNRSLTRDGQVLFLVPIGKHYSDCGHVAWFPDEECLRNVLDYVFDVEVIYELKTCRKMFAACRKRE